MAWGVGGGEIMGGEGVDMPTHSVSETYSFLVALWGVKGGQRSFVHHFGGAIEFAGVLRGN